MTNLFSGEGERLPYTNAGAAIASGDVVPLKHSIGIALGAIAATTGTGTLAVEGVFTVPKVTGTAWLSGEKLIWDTSAGKFDASSATPATGDITGACIAFGPAASAAATGLIKLTPGNATLT